MAYDLVLQTHPDQDISAHDFDTVQQELQRIATLQRLCEITLGRLAASHVDIVLLGEGLDFGDFSERDFTEFCSNRGLPADHQHEGAAAAFVRSRFGFPIATFKLPTTDEEARAAYSQIIHFALRHKLRVTDPQKGECRFTSARSVTAEMEHLTLPSLVLQRYQLPRTSAASTAR